jgi:hypothetical protein
LECQHSVQRINVFLRDKLIYCNKKEAEYERI